MKRTIILKAEDESKKIKITCQINNSFDRVDQKDAMYQFSESFADKLFDILREYFFSNSIRRISP